MLLEEKGSNSAGRQCKLTLEKNTATSRLMRVTNEPRKKQNDIEEFKK